MVFVWLHLVWSSLGLSMLLLIALFHSFYGWIIFHSIHLSHLLYPSVNGCIGCFHVMVIVNSAAMNTWVHTGDKWRNNSRKNEGLEPKQKQYPVMDVTGDRSKVWCCKEQYCTGTWNVRSMNQGKLEVVKQEMARVNADILGVSKLKWTGMGECKSDDHYIYYCGQESLRRNGVAIMVNKRVQNAILGCNLKNDRTICCFPR